MSEYAKEMMRVREQARESCLEMYKVVDSLLKQTEELERLLKPYARPSPWDRDLNSEWAEIYGLEKLLKRLKDRLAWWKK